MGYKPSHQVTWESSPIYHVRKYRDPETIQREQAMEDFRDWLEYDAEDVTEEQWKAVKALVTAYLGYDLDKVRAGEAEMLRLWTEE